MVYAEIKDYTFITLGLLLYTFAWTVFLLPYKIVTGGVTGISALIFFATKDTYCLYIYAHQCRTSCGCTLCLGL